MKLLLNKLEIKISIKQKLFGICQKIIALKIYKFKFYLGENLKQSQ